MHAYILQRTVACREMHTKRRGKKTLTLGRGGRRLGIEPDDQCQHRHEDAAAAYAADAPERGTQEADQRTQHDAPSELHGLFLQMTTSTIKPTQDYY
jgi:hypothetical protein